MPVVAGFESLSEQLARTTAECERLREENVRLRKLLALGGHDRKPVEPAFGANTAAAPTPLLLPRSEQSAVEKIALFRSLFRGRNDVYAVRFESADGKSGYAPASVRDWKALSNVPLSERKRQDKATRRLLPLTDEIIYQHLSGKITVGVYPLLADDTCWFLAVDFDEESWSLDALAFVESCRESNVPAALERSRSENGAHVWVFFTAPIAAALARKLGAGLLTRAMARRHQVRLRSYDRLFPNQDTMPTGGFGNLIALPLQKKPRRDDNSVFVDNQLKPFTDQWSYLAGIPRMEPMAVEMVVRGLERNGNVIGVRMSLVDDNLDEDPWLLPPSRRAPEKPIAGPLPASVRVVRANLLYIAKKELPEAMLDRLSRLAAFQNPEFYKAQAMRLPTFNKPRVIGCAEEFRIFWACQGPSGGSRFVVQAAQDVHRGRG